MDRLEIVSPGGLPAGMTEADLGMKSIPRNPLLFGILHRMEAVERTCLRAVTHRQVGSGIRPACSRQAHPATCAANTGWLSR